MDLVRRLSEAALTAANLTRVEWVGFCKIDHDDRPLSVNSCFSNCLSCRSNCVSATFAVDMRTTNGVPLAAIR